MVVMAAIAMNRDSNESKGRLVDSSGLLGYQL